MCVSCTQWQLNPSHQVQCPYADIECKQVTRTLIEASRHIYGLPNIACRPRIYLKRRYCATSVSSYVGQRARAAVCLNAALSKGPEVMVATLTILALANFIAQYRRILGISANMPIS
ncbi:hypothetical protein TNCV_1517691 [Trichonephila clavipes]|nr:hypothetical protein TNCV_1517691 [Trichonephila clavipes]